MLHSVTLRVPATTANLGPGFDCLGLALNLHNTVTLAPAAVTEVVIQGEGAGHLPGSDRNLVLQAASALAARAGVTIPGWRLEAHNEIPLARGLGSSSAALVAGLVACDRLLELATPPGDLLDLATELEGHPDNVAPALYGGLTVCAIEGGRTWCLALPAPARLWVGVALPDFLVSTEQARQALPASYSREAAVYNVSHAALTLGALVHGRYDLLRAAMRDHLHQPYRMSLVPGMAQAIAAAEAAGAYAAVLSGSGPAIAAFCGQPEPAVEAALVAAFAREGLSARVRWLEPASGALAEPS